LDLKVQNPIKCTSGLCFGFRLSDILETRNVGPKRPVRVDRNSG
jgi:hypothetical protein